MRPTLTLSLRVVILGASLAASAAYGDYSGGQIINRNDPDASIPIESGNIIIDYTVDGAGEYERSGGIERSGAEGANGTTTIEGNISVTARGDSDWNHGILVASHPDKAEDWITDDDPAYNSTVILKTVNENDAIQIDVNGLNACGVGVMSSGSTVKLDAANSTQGIIINLNNTGDSLGISRGVSADHGTVDIKGNITVNAAAGQNGYGLYVYGELGNITVDGVTTINTGDSTTSGIRANMGTVRLGDLNITDANFGIWANTGGVIELTGEYNIQSAATYGIYAGDNAQITFYGSGNTHQINGGVGIRTYGGGDVLIEGIANINAVNSGIHANSGSSVRLLGASVNIESGTQGIISDSGSVRVAGSAVISSGHQGVRSTNGANITLEGKTTINTDYTVGVTAFGFNETGERSSVTFKDETVINTGSVGLSVYQGGLVNAEKHLTIVSKTAGSGSNSDAAIYAGTPLNGQVAQINLNGVTISGPNRLAVVASAGSEIKGNSGLYRIDGNLYANVAGMIDLKMTDGSYLNGLTTFATPLGVASTGTINLDIRGDSLWNVTGNSQLTNLTLGQGSALQIAFNGSSLNDIVSATGTITFEEGSYIYLMGDLADIQGNAFDFFTGTIDNQGQGVKFVGFNGTDWVEYQYTQTGTNTFEFSAGSPVVIEAPNFLAAIPEPASATLGLLGLASLMMRRRRA